MRLQRRAQNRRKDRELRASQTEAESILWRELPNRGLDGLKFRRQHRAGFFIVDFNRADAGLGVEIDGANHFTDEGKRNDETRTRWLEERGARLIRFTNAEVVSNLKLVLKRIRNEVDRGGG